jgi:hypothetical protein
MTSLELDGYLTGIVVTPHAVPILPERWIAHLWDEEPVFDDDLQIKLVLGPAINRYNVLGTEIDRSLKRSEGKRLSDRAPLAITGRIITPNVRRFRDALPILDVASKSISNRLWNHQAFSYEPPNQSHLFRVRK